MSKCAIFQNPETGIAAVFYPAPGFEDRVQETVQTMVPVGTPIEVVDVATIPVDRTFRNAWKVIGKAIDHDLVKAKELAHARRRDMRQGEMAPLDLEATIPAKAVAAEAARAVLRTKYDLMQTKVDAAKNVADLKTALGLA